MTDKEKPRLIVVAGPNGSGKTSITQQLLMHEWMDGCVYVNPDFIARDEFGDWNAPDAVIQAARRAAEIREHCLTKGHSLAFETVLSAPDKMNFIRRAQDAGFFHPPGPGRRFFYPPVLRRHRRSLHQRQACRDASDGRGA